MSTGSAVRWSSLALTRSLVEASAQCTWLIDPDLDLEARLRRTNQMFVRACHEMLNLLPDGQETTPRFLSIDPTVKEHSLKGRDDALEWARAQGWTCRNGKTITQKRWTGEIPSHKEAVALAAQGAVELASQGTPAYWKDVYGMLSGATHSQPLLFALSMRDGPDTFLDRALMVLDFGVAFYKQALRQFARFMGWNDHDVDSWFGPVHATIEHMRFPEDAPLPVSRVRPEQCQICPEYQDPAIHRLALASHLCALLERNIDGESSGGTDAPARYNSAVEFINKLQANLMNSDDADSKTQKLSTALGREHAGVLALFGTDPSEVLTSIAASWAVMGSPDYKPNIGKVQGWLTGSDDQSDAVPYGNE